MAAATAGVKRAADQISQDAKEEEDVRSSVLGCRWAVELAALNVEDSRTIFRMDP